MTHTNYVNSLVASVGALLAATALINFLVDPARIYRTDAARHSEYVSALLRSKSGLLWPDNSLNERAVKRRLAYMTDDADCAIIGSSRVLQVSSVRGVLPSGLCDKLVNLGVAGATLEDYFALIWELHQGSSMPKRVVLGIDPWALDFRKDWRWIEYSDSYYSMRGLIDLPDNSLDGEASLEWHYLRNLISADYLLRSIGQIGVADFSITPAPEFEYAQGIEHPVMLPDGSKVYRAEKIRGGKTAPVAKAGSGYKIRTTGPQHSEGAVWVFSQLVGYLSDNGSDVTLLLAPYHPQIWSSEQSLTVRALRDMESRIRRLARVLGVSVLGSYDPRIVGCHPVEFHDEMHPSASCLRRIL